jgi:hypothetical protein
MIASAGAVKGVGDLFGSGGGHIARVAESVHFSRGSSRRLGLAPKVAALQLLLSAAGCAVGASVTPHTELEAATVVPKATFVVSELTRPSKVASSKGLSDYAVMQEEVWILLPKAGLSAQIVDERKLGPAGVDGPVYLLRYRIIEDAIVHASTGVN